MTGIDQDRQDRVRIAHAIAEHADAITTLRLEDPLDDLETLGRRLDGVAVVALGHPLPTRELDAVGSRIVRYLVERCGVRTLALEDTPSVGRAMDRYVQAGGDLDAVMARAFTPHRMPSFSVLLEWLRTWSARHPDDAVRVIGADAADSDDVDGDVVTASFPPSVHSPGTGRSAGSHLRARFGRRFRSIAMTFRHGVGDEPVPAPSPTFVEHVLGEVDLDRYLVDLHELSGGDPAVRWWLHAPAVTRVIGPFYDSGRDADYHLVGGSLADWFDLIVHVREVTPVGLPSADLDGAPPGTRAAHTDPRRHGG